MMSSATKLGSIIAEAVAEAAQRVMSGKWSMEGEASASAVRVGVAQQRRRQRSSAHKRTARESLDGEELDGDAQDLDAR